MDAELKWKICRYNTHGWAVINPKGNLMYSSGSWDYAVEWLKDYLFYAGMNILYPQPDFMLGETTKQSLKLLQNKGKVRL